MRKRPNDVEKLEKISQSVNPDGQGNLTVNKNLGVDGKLTLKSLVSESNLDGDITKELSGAAIHVYMVIVNDMFSYPVYTSKDYGLKNTTTVSNFWTDENYKELRPTGRQPASGYLHKDTDGTDRIMCSFIIGLTPNRCYASGYELDKKQTTTVNYDPGLHAQVRQLY